MILFHRVKDSLRQDVSEEKTQILFHRVEHVFLQKREFAGVILLRVKGQDTTKKISIIKGLLESYEHKLLRHFVVVTEGKIRIIDMEDIK